MPKFIYRRGEEYDGSKMPAEVDLFGIEFTRDQPTAVDANMFRTPGEYEHALSKLRANKYFEEVKIEDATFEEVAPDKPKRGRKAAALPPPDETPA